MITPTRYTSQKQQERISRHQFCERLEEFGWIASPSDEDLGEDFSVHIYFEGRATGVIFHAQLKSVTNLDERRQGDYLVYDGLKVKDLKHWEDFSLPVALVIWDVNLREGRWALVDDIIKELDQRRPQWRENKSKVRVRLPWENGTDDRGLVWLRQNIGHKMYPLISKGKKLEIKNLKFYFPDTSEGRTTWIAFDQAIKIGEPVTIKEKFLYKFELSEWWMKWFGKDNLINLNIEPRVPTQGFLANIDMLPNYGEIASLYSIELKVIKIGAEAIKLSNEHQHSPLNFQFDISSKNFAISVILNNLGQHVKETYDIMKLLQAITAGGTLKLNFLNFDAVWDFPLPPNPENAPDPEFLKFVDKLCKIQANVDCFIRAPIDGLASEDMHAIRKLEAIIEQGKTITYTQEITIEFKEPDKDILFEIYRQKAPVLLRMSSTESFIKLLDLEIPVGPLIRYVSGTLATPITELEEAIKQLAPGEFLAIKFTDAEVVDIYPKWHIREAERLSQLLVKNFDIDAIYLFGSLVWNEVHAPETDIDLAVSGLPGEQLFKAIGFLERETKISVDLVDLDKIPDYLRQRILTKGQCLYERKPALAASR